MPLPFRANHRFAIFSKLRSPILCVCLTLVAACGQGGKPPEDKGPPPANVKWEGPLQGALEEWTELVGTTLPLPDRVAFISAPVGGSVVSVLTDAKGKPVAEGQQVARGTVLVQLDAAVVKANLARLEAA